MVANQAGGNNDSSESGNRKVDGEGSDSADTQLVESTGVADNLDVRPKRKKGDKAGCRAFGE